MDNFVQSLEPSIQDKIFSNNPHIFLFLPDVHQSPTDQEPAVPLVSDHPTHSTEDEDCPYLWYALGMSLHLSELPLPPVKSTMVRG